MYIRLIVYLSVYADICRVYDVCIYLYTCRKYIYTHTCSVYTIQYTVHIVNMLCMYMYIYICVHYIYQYCKHVIVPQRGYIYISQQWDGVPLNSLTSKGTILDC